MFPESVPIIGMSKWDDPKVSEAICEDAGKWGFFQIINHEYLRMLRKQLTSSSGYHLRRRGKYPKELSPSNNVRFGSNFSPEAEKALEWKDYLSFMSPRMRLLRCGLLLHLINI
ncbi:hypothetical protein OIU84_021474 [Salix udensis]|uniref:Non-haem dioxygenase N-terminal domain-containing protein n=1 Tax=Salix udensis TaxID=889485 RepID=A0AAD6KUP4_9ROSI|nr:hypothetical protein OIU84_021474 [Salix udensis]